VFFIKNCASAVPHSITLFVEFEEITYEFSVKYLNSGS